MTLQSQSTEQLYFVPGSLLTILANVIHTICAFIFIRSCTIEFGCFNRCTTLIPVDKACVLFCLYIKRDKSGSFSRILDIFCVRMSSGFPYSMVAWWGATPIYVVIFFVFFWAWEMGISVYALRFCDVAIMPLTRTIG